MSIGSGQMITESATGREQSIKAMVKKVGSYYHVFDDGVFSLSTSSLESAINDEARNILTASRTWQETILLIGNLALDGLIELDSHTILELIGYCYMGDNVNTNMVSNADKGTSNTNILVKGGVWEQSLTQTTGGPYNVFDFLNTTAGTGVYVPFTLEDLFVYQADNYAMSLTTLNQPVRVHNVDVVGLNGGIYLANVTDALINHCHFAANDGSGKAINIGGGGGQTHLVGIKTDGYVWLQGVSELVLSDFCIDIGERHLDGIYAYNVRHTTIGNGKVRLFGDNSYTDKFGINLVTDSSSWGNDNQFCNIEFYSSTPTGSDRFAYGIAEQNGGANPDNNQYANINGRDCATGALYLLGATSKGQHQNIIGTVTEA